MKRKNIASWERVGSIRGHLLTHFGAQNIDFPLVFKGFREHQHFGTRSVSESDPGLKLEQKDSQLGTPNEAKTAFEGNQKRYVNFDGFLSGLEGPRPGRDSPRRG